MKAADFVALVRERFQTGRGTLVELGYDHRIKVVSVPRPGQCAATLGRLTDPQLRKLVKDGLLRATSEHAGWTYSFVRRYEPTDKLLDGPACACRKAKRHADCAYCGSGVDRVCGQCRENGIDGPVIRGTEARMCSQHKAAEQVPCMACGRPGCTCTGE